jgi:hypothetical protein
MLGDGERRLPRPRSRPVEIGVMREQVLRSIELPAVAGLPE